MKTTHHRPSGAWTALGALLILAGALGVYLHLSAPRPVPASSAGRAAAKRAYQNRSVLPASPTYAAATRERAPSIQGRIYDTRGDLIAGATVVAATFDVTGNTPSVVGSVQSDAEGRFAFTLPEGIYQLNAARAGYGPTSVTARSGEPVSLVLPRSGVIRGHVRDQRGEPVRRFTLDIVSVVPGEVPAPPPLSSRVLDSADGSFRADELPAWPFVVRVSSADLAPALSPPLSVGAGEEREIDLALSAGCAVSGVVIDGAGSPLPGVLVNAERRDVAGSVLDPTMLVKEQTESDERGRFRLEHVPHGTLLVRGYDGSRAVGTVTVQVGACDALAPVVLVMSGGGGIDGQARFADGRPLAGAVLTVMERSIGFVSTTSGEDGHFHFDGLPAGSLRVELAHGEQRVQQFVGVVDGETVRHDMTLFAEGSGELRGRVTAGATPVAGARVLVAASHGAAKGLAVYFPATDEDGTFRLRSLPAGAYLVSLVSGNQAGGARVEDGGTATVELDVSRERVKTNRGAVGAR